MNAKGFALALLFFISATALVISGLAMRSRFAEGTHARHEICQQITVIKGILYDEHTAKLHSTVRYLNKHPNGVPSIGVSRQDLFDAIAVERRIVNQTKPMECP